LAAALVVLTAAPALAEPVAPEPVSDDGRVADLRDHYLGGPTSGVREVRGGTYQQFAYGAVYSSPAGGTHVVALDFQEAWGRSGWENGPLGLPIADEVELAVGAFQLFQGGSVYWSPASGVHVLWGAVRDRWAAQGWERGELGYPVGDEVRLRNGVYQLFQGGSVYWSPTTGAHVVRRAVRDRWAAQGWENSFLGYPITDEAPSGYGVYQLFQGGAIYSTPGNGTHAVAGAIRDRWAAQGWENGILGWPMSEEVPLRNGAYQMFQTMQSIYWSPDTGAHVVRGSIRTAWGRLGWENGRLGYPVGDEVVAPGSRWQDFAHGRISVDNHGNPTITYR
jgi:uncharacterized protein with LGFP repeats